MIPAATRRLLVFARAPVAGQCKTRLIPALGAQGAARVHRQLTLATLRCALAASAPVQLYCAPDPRHPFFAACRTRDRIALRRQCRGDLGARMAGALRDAMRGGATSAVIVGTDCAVLSPADLDTAFATLEQGADYVLQPASDGGFVLLGARIDDPQVLRGVDWSSGRELAQTLAHIRRRGHRSVLLAERWDVDDRDDLRRARNQGLIEA